MNVFALRPNLNLKFVSVIALLSLYFLYIHVEFFACFQFNYTIIWLPPSYLAPSAFSCFLVTVTDFRPSLLFLENISRIESLLYSLGRTSVAVLVFLNASLVMSRKVHILRDGTKRIWSGRTEFGIKFTVWSLNKCKCTFSQLETSPQKVSPVLFCPVLFAIPIHIP